MILVKENTNPITFEIGKVYDLDGGKYILLSCWKDEGGQRYYCMLQLGVNKFHFLVVPKSVLSEKILNGEMNCYRNAEDYISPDLKPGDRKKADYRYACIKRFVDNLHPHYEWLQNRRVDKSKLYLLADEIGLDVKNVRRLLLRYLQEGQTPASLADQRMIRPCREDYNPYSGAVKGPKHNGIASTALNDEILF